MILYTIGCPKCIILEKLMEKKQVKFDICEDVGIMENKGIMSVPVLEVDGELLHYNEAVKYINAL